MKKINKITIITASLNCEKYVEKAIQSVKIQSYPEIEYLVIDGGSTDGTIDVINHYQDDIDCFISERDSGIYNAMNKGIKNAGGDILFFLNSDDQFCDGNVVSDIMHYFNSQDKLDLVYGDVLLDMPHGITRWYQNPELSRKSLARNTISHQSIFVKKEIFSRTNGFSEKYRIVSDFVWLMELAHSNINSMHVERDITIVSTEGLSHITEWEDERLAAMRDYYTPAEIFLWRRLPRKMKSMVNYLKHITKKLRNYNYRKAT